MPKKRKPQIIVGSPDEVNVLQDEKPKKKPNMTNKEIKRIKHKCNFICRHFMRFENRRHCWYLPLRRLWFLLAKYLWRKKHLKVSDLTEGESIEWNWLKRISFKRL